MISCLVLSTKLLIPFSSDCLKIDVYVKFNRSSMRILRVNDFNNWHVTSSVYNSIHPPPYPRKQQNRSLARYERLTQNQQESAATTRDSSSPLPKQRHKSRTKGHRPNSAQNLFDRRPLHVPAEHELMRHELHQTGIDQNTG